MLDSRIEKLVDVEAVVKGVEVDVTTGFAGWVLSYFLKMSSFEVVEVEDAGASVALPSALVLVITVGVVTVDVC